MKIGFLGAGKMAQAMARGLLASGTFTRNRIIASAIDDHSTNEMRSLGVEVTDNNMDVVDQSDIVFVAVRPNDVQTVLRQVSPSVTPDNLIVSVAAGVSLEVMEQCLPLRSRVVRAMPNMATAVGQGASAFSLGNHVTERDRQIMTHVMSAMGYVEEVKETDLAAVTGLTASGPAYSVMVMEAIADGGVKAGLSQQLALNLAAHTLLGNAKLALQPGQYPGELKDAVYAPQGPTALSCAVQSLERAGLRTTLMDAVESSIKRANEFEVANQAETNYSMNNMK